MAFYDASKCTYIYYSHLQHMHHDNKGFQTHDDTCCSKLSFPRGKERKKTGSQMPLKALKEVSLSL